MKVAEARDGDIILRIHQDELAESPRVDYDNLGTMVCFHKRYSLGDEDEHKPGDFEGWQEVERHLTTEHDAVVVLPLCLYDHSGLRMKVGSFQGLLPQGHAEFDSGQIGFIYCSRDVICKEYNTKRVTSKLKRLVGGVLEGEVMVYDQYLQGDVYGFELLEIKHCSLKHEHEEHIGGCFGFYGHDWKENGMMEHVEDKYHYLFDRLEDC